MKIYKYSFRNIGPFSNIPTMVDFETSKAHMNMMIGENGIGKSTIINILKFGLYHDLAYSGDIKVDEIANDINRNGEIIVELNSRGKDWTIITNFSPNKINVYEGRGDEMDEKPLDKGGLPETKRFIRDQILDIPFYIFDNILSIDVSEFKSLLTLNADDTRKIRDRIFGFSIMNEIATEVKKRLNGFVEQRKLGEHDLAGMEERLVKLMADIENMKEQVKSGLKVDDIQVKLDAVKNNKTALEASYKTLGDELAQANNDFRHHNNVKYKVEIASLTEEKLGVEVKIKAIIDEQTEIDSSIEKIQEYAEVATLTKTVNEDTDKFKEQNNKLASFKTDYEEIVAKVKDVNDKLEIVNDHLFKTDLKDKYTTYGELSKKIAEHNEWIDGQNRVASSISDENSELKSTMSSLQSALRARKAGLCNECGTQFDHKHDEKHEEHIRELEVKIEETEDKYESNKAKATEILGVLTTRNNEMRTMESKKSLLGEEIKKATASQGRTEISDFASLEKSIKEHTEFWATKYEGDDAKGDATRLEAELAELKTKGTKIKDDGNMLKGQLTSFRESIVKNQARLKELKTKFSEQPTGNIDALREKRAQLVTKRNELHKQENSLDVQIQVTTSKLRDDVKEPIKYTAEEADKMLGDKPQEINSMKQKIDQAEKEIFEHEKSIEIANNAANLNLQSGHLKKQSKEVSDQIKEKKAELADLKSKIERQEFLLEVIKKTKDEVLRVNIPYINHMVVNTCKRIGVTQMLTFDDSFTPHIFRGNREVSLKSASLGQRKKMNFAVLISITKFLKLRYGGLNIIFYDEMFSSIDEKGRPHMLDIIRQEIVENLGIHVWLTNHFFIPNSQFDNYIIVEGKSGFSSARKIDAGELLSLDQYTEKQAVIA